MTQQHASLSRIALSLALATSLTAAPLTTAAAENDTAATSATEAAATSEEEAVDEESTVAIDPEAWTADEERNAEIIDAAEKAELVGSTALAKYLAGDKVGVEAFLHIDVNRLADIDEDLAKLIDAEQKKLTEDKGDSGDDPVVPISPDTTDNATNSGNNTATDASTANASSDATEATEVIDAPDDAVATKENTDQEADEIVYVARNLTTEQFIDTIGEDARQLCQDNDLYASVMIAQAIVESASGSSGLSCDPYNNLFGIKGSYQGKSVRMKTQEDDGEGNLETVVAEFRRYSTLKESLTDYVSLLTGNSLYSPVKKSNTSSYEDACDYLQGHYATSTSYSKTLKAYIDAYNLTSYDEAGAENQVVRGDTLDAVLVPNATHTSYQSETSDLGLSDGVVIEEPTRQLSPAIVGILAAGAAALLGTGAFYLYWRRKVENEGASRGKHAAVAEALSGGETAAIDIDAVCDDIAGAKHAATHAEGGAHAAASLDSAETGEIAMESGKSAAGAHAGINRTKDEPKRADDLAEQILPFE